MMTVLAVVALVATACGSSDPDPEQSRSASAGDSLDAATVFGLGAGEPLASVRLQACSDLAARSLCQYAVNSTFVLTGPNKWSRNGESALTYSDTALVHGITTGWAAPDLIPNNPNASVFWRNESQGMFTGVESTTFYNAPDGYPPGEQVGFFGAVPYSASNSFDCRSGTYLRCRVVSSSGTKDATVLYEVTNAPVVVRITNRVGADVTREGEPAVTSFVVVPAAGDPATIAPGATGFAGGYRSISLDSRYTATYVVGDGDQALAGARAVVNVVIDHQTGTNKGSTCEKSNPRSTGVQLQCTVTISGGENGVVFADVTLSR
jgi:hypothetical protein